MTGTKDVLMEENKDVEVSNVNAERAASGSFGEMPMDNAGASFEAGAYGNDDINTEVDGNVDKSEDGNLNVDKSDESNLNTDGAEGSNKLDCCDTYCAGSCAYSYTLCYYEGSGAYRVDA